MADIKINYNDVKWQESNKLKLLIIVGTRPEIIRLAAVINACRTYFDVYLPTRAKIMIITSMECFLKI